jgi:hypothetical protein
MIQPAANGGAWIGSYVSPRSSLPLTAVATPLQWNGLACLNPEEAKDPLLPVLYSWKQKTYIGTFNRFS